MSARGFRLTVVAWLCGTVCVLAGGVISGVAGATQEGATQFGLTEDSRYTEGSLSGAGQLVLPTDVAVNDDSSSLFYGDVYVADYGNIRIDRFSGSGGFQLAWGWGVSNGANEPQTCTTSCQRGKVEEQDAPAPVNTGAVAATLAVAVDNNSLLDSSAGDVYVFQAGEIDRVEKFGPSGEFLLMFGGDVNENGTNVCAANEKCKRGTEGLGDGQFDSESEDNSRGLSPNKNIAVGPDGLVYVGDRARVQVFEPTGVWKETISLSKISSTGTVQALAVDSAGDVFVQDGGAPGVWEFEPGGIERSIQFDPGSTSVRGIAVDGSGDLFVGDSQGEFHVLKYAISSGKVAGSFGSKTVKGTESESFGYGMSFSEASGSSGTLYVPESYTEEISGTHYNSVWSLTIPPPGPSIEGVSATVGPRGGGATLDGVINPEGNQTKYHFEYVDEADFMSTGYADALSAPSGTLPEGIEGQAVSAVIVGLSPSTKYHYRLVATNSESSKGPAFSPDEAFESLPPVSIEAEYATDVASTSATIDADVDSFGVNTEYRLEYGLTMSYGHIVTGDTGESTTSILLSSHLQELAASTSYHYRFVLRNEFGVVEGADHSFTTQLSGAVSVLPDGRVWELVSPANKKGALIEPFQYSSEDQIQTGSDGNGIAYEASGPDIGENQKGNEALAQVLSKRGPSGWETVTLSLADEVPENGEQAAELGGNFEGYPLFSSDMSLAVVEPLGFGGVPLSPEATERTLYLRNDLNGSFSPLVSAADVPPGTAIEEPTFTHNGVKEASVHWEMHFLAGTPDLAHVVFKTPLALVPPAIDEETIQNGLKGVGGENEPLANLYEWGGGKLQLVNILPDDEATRSSFGRVVTLAGTEAAGADGVPYGSAARAVSSDGSRIAWTWGEPYGDLVTREVSNLYVRDMVEEKTVQVGGDGAVFQTMNSEGSQVFYRENGDLYVFDYETGISTDLTGNHGAGETSAGVKEMVSNVSENGSYVYFVATGVLANGAVSGEDNLYLSHDTASEWTTTFIATLSPQDEKDWFAEAHTGSTDLAGVTSRVAPDGRYLTFMSDRALTGYDNIDAVSGQPDEEVYLYDAQSGKLVCASCDPSGARPVGILANEEELAGAHWSNHWLAGSISGWDPSQADKSTYQPRYLDDSGRLFFNSPDALVPQDTDGLEDVYEYEPPANGETVGSDNCTSVSLTFSERSDGCVSLVSSGTSSSESVFYDASKNGDDVFFDTTSKLVGEDYDKGYDIYDAHVCSVTVPCKSVPVSPPPCTSGDSCKAAPSPQPEIFGAAPSATFEGVGNVITSPKPLVVSKSLTRAQKLARALKECHKKKAKKRAVCEREARKRYAVRRSAKAKRTGKGQG